MAVKVDEVAMPEEGSQTLTIDGEEYDSFVRPTAFPRLSSYGFWCYMIGSTIMIVALVAGFAM